MQTTTTQKARNPSRKKTLGENFLNEFARNIIWAMQNFLIHLRAAIDAAGRANESPWDVCEGLAIEDDCSRWAGQPIEELFPEEP